MPPPRVLARRMMHDLMDFVHSIQYPLNAILFVQRGLEYTVCKTHGDRDPAAAKETDELVRRHVSGQQLCTGLREYAIEQYGLMALIVLKRWNIHSCEDFGRIVFAMVDAKMMKKNDEDSLHDFSNVYEFAEAFSPMLKLTEKDISGGRS